MRDNLQNCADRQDGQCLQGVCYMFVMIGLGKVADTKSPGLWTESSTNRSYLGKALAVDYLISEEQVMIHISKDLNNLALEMYVVTLICKNHQRK